MLTATARDHLHHLCSALPTRVVGSAGNRAATDYVAARGAARGWDVERQEFDCLDWLSEGAALTAGGTDFEVFPSPYAPGCRVSAPLRVVETVEALEAASVAGAALLLLGPIAAEPLMPKNFPFYNPDEHQRIVRALEAARPAALVTATARGAFMAGGLYPCPLIEDGDFDIPSAYLTEEEGRRLARHAGQPVSLTVKAQRRAAQGCNVILRRGGGSGQRVVVMAHIDAKAGTPGAIDNASGSVVLLLLAELLAGYAGELALEIVAMNGEDYYSAPGEQRYLRANPAGFDDLALGINLDGVGYREGGDAYSLYNCPPALAAEVAAAFAPFASLRPGEPWYQGDHSLWLPFNRPVLALTSERALELVSGYIHTTRDTPDLVDPARLAAAAQALRALILRLLP